MTKIAISAASDQGLDAPVAQHFGRCPYFTVVEVDDLTVKSVQAVANPFYANHQPGEVPGFINTLGVNVMLSGGMGGRAVTFFQQFGIEPATGAQGKVGDALSQYLGGELSGAAPCDESTEHGH